MTRKFTGWHMTAILVAFFAVVIGVNLFMAKKAISTFGGLVVDNSYVASQKFDTWLAAADQQAALGWATTMALDKNRHLVVTARADGVPLSDLKGQVRIHHPLGRAPDREMRLVAGGAGILRSETALPMGRWEVRAAIASHAHTIRLREILQ